MRAAKDDQNLSSELLNAIGSDAALHELYVRGASLEAMVIFQAKERAALFKRLMELDLIAPRKIRVGGKLYVWQCPVDLIPEQKSISAAEPPPSDKH